MAAEGRWWRGHARSERTRHHQSPEEFGEGLWGRGEADGVRGWGSAIIQPNNDTRPEVPKCRRLEAKTPVTDRPNSPRHLFTLSTYYRFPPGYRFSTGPTR